MELGSTTGLYIGKDVDGLAQTYLRSIVDKNGSYYIPNKTRYNLQKMPVFRNSLERKLWEREEIRRCKQGHVGMTGKHYFYFNYCWIKTRSSSRKIRPDWRRIDAELFKKIEYYARGKGKGRGLWTVKRRGIGATWLSSADDLHEASFYPYSYIGVQSKTEDDAVEYLDRVKFIYEHLPSFLKIAAAKSYSRLKMKFGKVVDEKLPSGQIDKKTKGTPSVIICKHPASDTSWESSGLTRWKGDEAGKTKNIRRTLELTLPCMQADDGFSLGGFPWGFGTAGNIDEVGAEFSYIFYHSDHYRLDQHFIPGWAGLSLDALGNENVVKAVYKILEDRALVLDNERLLITKIQQYPLTPEEAFLSSKADFFPIKIINNRLNELYSMSPLYDKGNFEWAVSYHSVIWRPNNETGTVFLLEHPIKGQSQHVAGADPYDIEKREGPGSVGSLVIHKINVAGDNEGVIDRLKEDISHRERLTLLLRLGDLPVLLFSDNGTNPEYYFEQCAMALIYFNDTKVLVEKQRGGRMLGWFKAKELQRLLAYKPPSIAIGYERASVSSFDYGYHRSPESKLFDLGLVDSYFLSKCNKVYLPLLLERAKKYDPDVQKKKFDEIDAWAFALLQQDRMERGRFTSGKTEKSKLPSTHLENINGRLVRVPNKKINDRQRSISQISLQNVIRKQKR